MEIPQSRLVVRDKAELLNQARAFIQEGRLAARTKVGHTYLWKRWEQHCEAHETDALNASYEAWQALWTVPRMDGSGEMLASKTVESWIGAITDRYTQEGTTPAYRTAVHARDWEMLKRGATHRATNSSPKTAPPLMREHALAMLSAEYPLSEYEKAARAGVLLALDAGFTAPELTRLNRDDIHEESGGGLTIRGRHIPCQHTPVTRGVTHDCAACAVRSLDIAEGTILRAGPSRWANIFARLIASHDNLGTDTVRIGRGSHSALLQPVDGLTDWASAGLRRSLVLAAGYTTQGTGPFRWLRAQAWMGLAWTCGLRMASDLIDLPRSAMRLDPDGRGFVLALGQTKDDRCASKNVSRPITWTPGRPSIADAVAEYLCVRDVVIGHAGPLLVRVNAGALTAKPLKAAAAIEAASGDLRLLAQLAGIDTEFTSYSTRTGYSQQAIDDGWEIEDIRDGLRHMSVETTAGYTRTRDARRSAQRLIGHAEPTR